MSLTDRLIDIVAILPEAAPLAAEIFKSQREIDRHDSLALQSLQDQRAAKVADLEERIEVAQVKCLLFDECETRRLDYREIMPKLLPYCQMTGDELAIVIDGELTDFETAIERITDGEI